MPIYRYPEVKRSLASGQPIWMVEGEGCADALWNIGILATTTLGGSKKYRPKRYRLTGEAKALFADRYDQLDHLRVTETHQGLQAVYSKMQGYTGRLALILHCLQGAVDGRLTAERISAQTMGAATKLAQWFMGQVKLMYAEGDSVDGALEAVYTKLIQLSRVRGWLRAKDVRF